MFHPNTMLGFGFNMVARVLSSALIFVGF